MRLVTVAVLALTLVGAGNLEARKGKHAGHMHKIGVVGPPPVPVAQAPAAPVVVSGQMLTGLDRMRLVVGAPVMATTQVVAQVATPVVQTSVVTQAAALPVAQEVQVSADRRALVTRGDVFAVPLTMATPVLTAVPTVQSLQGAPVVLSTYVTGVPGPVLLR